MTHSKERTGSLTKAPWMQTTPAYPPPPPLARYPTQALSPATLALAHDHKHVHEHSCRRGDHSKSRGRSQQGHRSHSRGTGHSRSCDAAMYHMHDHHHPGGWYAPAGYPPVGATGAPANPQYLFFWMPPQDAANAAAAAAAAAPTYQSAPSAPQQPQPQQQQQQQQQHAQQVPSLHPLQRGSWLPVGNPWYQPASAYWLPATQPTAQAHVQGGQHSHEYPQVAHWPQEAYAFGYPGDASGMGFAYPYGYPYPYGYAI